MATFAKTTFSAASYAAFRPTYPASLYNEILAYHSGRKELCLDLGCGTGIVTRALAPYFDRIIGSDPSLGMIKKAREQTTEPKIEYQQGAAESSSFLGENEVDLVTAGQAAHWFNYEELWPELKRIVRKAGTVAFWGYKDPSLVDYPVATRILNRDSYGSDPGTLGPYWPLGREYVRDQLRIIQPPSSDFEDVKRVEYEPGLSGPHSGKGTLFMQRSATIGQTKEYFRTSSSFNGWQEAHPDQIARARGGKGDLIDRMFDEMAEHYDSFRDEENVVKMEWGSALVMCRRR